MSFNIQWYSSLNSTNQEMKKELTRNNKLKNYSIISTYNQTNGVGRFNRKWVSTHNANLCFSIFIESNSDIKNIPSLTMCVALGVNDFLKSHNIKSNLKWPNDVMVKNKKICGILSEHIDIPKNNLKGAIVGIGLNTNMTSNELKKIDQPATSMLVECGMSFPLIDTLNDLCEYLFFWIKKWEINSSFESIKKYWITNSANIGDWISIRDQDNKICGKLAGYGDYGELLLNINGKIQTIWSGDIEI